MKDFSLKDPKNLITIFVVLFVLIAIPLTVISIRNARDQRSQAANTTALYLSPASQSLSINGDLVVQVRENSGTTFVTTADITLTYDPARFDFVQVDPIQPTDPFNAQIGTPTGGGGQVNFVRYVSQSTCNNPPTGCGTGIAGDRLVGTVRFKARTVAGATAINIANTSVIYGLIGGNDETSTRTGGTYTITDTPPTVSMTAPAPNSFVTGTNVTLSATAIDNLGVVGVEFYDGATLIGTRDTTNPYSVVWNTTVAGVHNLTAKAFDINGSSTSSVVPVTVDNTAPTGVAVSGLAAKVNGSVTVSATATDTNIDRVEFKVDSGAVTSDTTAPYTYLLNTTTVADGNRVLTATAFDKAGNSTPATQGFTVDNTPPTSFTLTATVSGQTQVNLSWTASTDALNGPVRYDVYRGGVKITPSPLTVTAYSDTGLTASTTYTYVVKALDSMAVSNTRDSNTQTVTTPAPPKIGDINGDNFVNSQDLAILVNTWASTTDLRADLNGDGIVGSADLARLISRWGT